MNYAKPFYWLFFANLFVANSVLAIHITEIHPTAEYIEIFSEATVDTNGWKYSELSGGTEKFYPLPFSTIGENEYKIIPLSSKINDTGDTIRVYNENNETIDEIGVPAKKDTMSYSLENGIWIWKIPTPAVANETPSATLSDTPEPTPTEIPEETFAPSPSPLYLPNIIISEMLPDPEGTDGPENEYIELFNNSAETVILQNFYIQDTSGKKYIFTDEILEAYEYKIFFRNQTGILLNNDGEKISLYAPNETLLASLEYTGTAEPENSFGIENTWEIPSPNEKNNADTSPTPLPFSGNTQLILSEMIPDPEGTDGPENEYFEIFNTSEESILLTGFYVQDASGKKYFFESQTIEPKTYLAIYRLQSGITINNENEILSLFSPMGEKISELSFDKTIPEGKAWGKSGESFCEIPPSPNQQNGGCLSVSIGSGGSSENQMIPFEKLSKNTNNVLLQIQTISPNASPDSISIECTKCDTDIGGIRIGIDGVAYTIPENTYAKTGDILRFVFEKDTTKAPEKLGGGWLFFVPLSGLSLSDETIMIVDGESQIIDGMCYSNRNDYLESKEKKEIAIMILQQQWQDELSEYGCVNASVMPKNASLVKKNSADTNSANDFEIQIEQDTNTHTPHLQFSFFVVSTEILEGKIINQGETNISLKNIGLYEAGKEIILFEEDILVPKQEFVFRIPLEKRKTWNLDALILELRSTNTELLDILCFNWNNENEIPSLQKRRLEEALLQNKWSIDFHTPKCFSQFSNNTQSYQKIDFTKTGVSSYQQISGYTTLFIEPQKKEKKMKEKKSSSQKEKKSIEPKLPENQLWGIKITKILPNPDGTDGGKEEMFLVNSGEKAGFARNWKIQIERNGKKTEKKLPNIFLIPSEKIQLKKPFLASLNNSNTTIYLINPLGETVQTISWKKAREEEWFGPNAPKFIEKSKTKKTKKAKSKKIKSQPTPKEPNEIFIFAKIQFVDKDVMIMKGEDGIWYAKNFPEYLPESNTVYAVGNHVKIHIIKGKIADIRPILLPQHANIQNIKWSFVGMIGSSLGISLFGGSMWGISRKKKKDKINKI